MRLLKALIGTTLVVGGLLVASLAASAAGVSQSTTLSLTIPATISITGLAASYNAGSGAAGTTLTVSTGPLTVSTNNSAGYHVSVVAGGNFTGAVATNTFPSTADTVSVTTCPTGDTCTSGALPTGATALTVVNRTTAPPSAGDVFTLSHSIAIPAGQAADSYSASVTVQAITN